MMMSTINLNTEKCVETTTDTLKVQTTGIATAMRTTAMEFQLSNLQVIAQSLTTTLPSLPAHNHLTANLSMHNGRTIPQFQAPPGFHNPPPTNNNNQCYNIYSEMAPS